MAFSRYPEVPLFGRAARETRLEALTLERDNLAERYATLSFDVQKFNVHIKLLVVLLVNIFRWLLKPTLKPKSAP